MLNRTMNKALEAISAMSYAEKMLYMSICFDDAIMDKDCLTGEDMDTDKMPCIVTYNSGTQASKNFNPKYIRKDKAKAGYHNGARNEGFGHYNRFGKPEKLAKDANKDFKAQLMELGELPDDITLNEAVGLLVSIYDMFYFGDFNMELVWYHKSEWYNNLQKNISMVESAYREYVDKLQSIQINLYWSAETLFPEMGMSFQNRVVELYNSMVMEDLNHMKKRMIHWLVCRYKDNRQYEMFEEELRHNAEIDRLNKLMEEAEKYIK